MLNLSEQLIGRIYQRIGLGLQITAGGELPDGRDELICRTDGNAAALSHSA